MKRLGIQDHLAEFPLVDDATGLGWEIGTRGDSIDGSRVDITTSIPADPAHYDELRPFATVPPADAKRSYGRAVPDAPPQHERTRVIPRPDKSDGPDAEVFTLPTRAPSAVAPAPSGVEALIAAPASGALVSGGGSAGAEMSVPMRASASRPQGISLESGRSGIAGLMAAPASGAVSSNGRANGSGASLSDEVFYSEGSDLEPPSRLMDGRSLIMHEIPGLLPPGYYTSEQLKAIMGDAFDPTVQRPLEFSNGGGIWDKTLGLFGVVPKQNFTPAEWGDAEEAVRHRAANMTKDDRKAAAKAYLDAGSTIGPSDEQ